MTHRDSEWPALAEPHWPARKISLREVVFTGPITRRFALALGKSTVSGGWADGICVALYSIPKRFNKRRQHEND